MSDETVIFFTTELRKYTDEYRMIRCVPFLHVFKNRKKQMQGKRKKRKRNYIYSWLVKKFSIKLNKNIKYSLP